MHQQMATATRSMPRRRGHAHALRSIPDLAASPVEIILRTHYRMTPREAQVAILLAFRCSNKEVACRLGIAYETARHHAAQVLSKLGLSSRSEVRDRLAAPQAYRPVFFGQPQGLLQ